MHDHGHGSEGGERGETLVLDVPEMDCASCAGKVGGSLEDLTGVRSVETRPTAGTAIVEYDADEVTREAVVEAVERAGYPVANTRRESERREAVERDPIWTSPRGIKTWISGVATLSGLVLAFALPGLDDVVIETGAVELLTSDLLFLVAVAVAGQVILRNGYYSARGRSLDIDLLMSIAVVGALVVSVAFGESYYFEAASLAFLFNVAELLEAYSMERARASLRELVELAPDEATVRRDGEEVVVPVEALAVGDVVLVRPGEKIPVDGTVDEGESAVDQSPITGESVPVDKVPGDEVYAGTIVESGYLEVTVETPAGSDTLSRIVELVEAAQSERTEREQFVERFAGYYTPVIVVLAVLVAVAPPLIAGADWATFVIYGLTLLVLACPCAFVISTPVSVVSGITSAARNGVLIEGGRHLESMGSVEAIAFDKTGTLTEGELRVTDVVPLNGHDEDDVLRCARGLERRSEHPIGEAIVDRAEASNLAGRDVEAFESITGKGVRADLDGTTHYAGKPGLFADLGFDLTHVHAATDGGLLTTKSRELCERNDCADLLADVVPRLQGEGKTVVLVGTEDELEGVIAVADEVRPGARAAVEALRERGVRRLVMLTGDNERTARAIADEVGVDDYRAELLPEEKVEAVEDLDEEFSGGVAMVGDGINDAPALATATVGIAMGAAGTDTAIETADVALMSDDLSKLPYLYELSGRAVGVIRQNVWSSLGAKAALAVAVPFGYVPLWAAVLLGDMGMTLGVTGNAMRLARIEPDGDGE